MKKLAYALFAVAILLSDIMCAHVAYLYRAMLCGIEHMGYSAPANTAFLFAIPYLFGIAAFTAFGFIILIKAKKRQA